MMVSDVRFELTFFSVPNGVPLTRLGESEFKLGCGSWIRTSDLQLMRLTKCQLFHPAITMVEDERIELSISACKADVIPFN